MIGDRPVRGCSSMVEQQPSKLNTRVRFPSPAPMFSSTCCILSSPFGQAGWRSFGQMSVFCSRCPPLFGPADDLFRGALHVLRQYFDRRMPTLRQHLAVGQLSIAALGEAAMAERGERQLIAQDSGTPASSKSGIQLSAFVFSSITRTMFGCSFGR